MEPKGHHRESGQAAVESALTLPLTVFLILGTLQIFMLLQARIMAQYAVFQATRAGSISQGDCEAMTHTAILALVPAFRSFIGPGSPGGSPGEKLANEWGRWRNNNYGGYSVAGEPGWGNGEAIVWLVREEPQAFGANAIQHFDQPLDGGDPVRLTVKMVFWAPMRIPFANWVIARSVLAQWGLMSYTAQNPLLETQTANWQREGRMPLSGAIANELQARVGARHYVMPIVVTSSMRMMTPVKRSYFGSQNCPPAPPAI